MGNGQKQASCGKRKSNRNRNRNRNQKAIEKCHEIELDLHRKTGKRDQNDDN